MNKLKNITIFYFLFSISFQVFSANISGTVIVYKKNGNTPLKSFENAIIYIDGLTSSSPTTRPILGQKNKQFTSRLLPVIKGQTVNFPNFDRVQHNVFSTNKLNPFDLGRYKKKKSKSVQFNNLGQQKIYCNIHQKMIADIIILENKYFSMTDKTGQYKIQNIPEGTYTVNVWHIYGGSTKQKITVSNKNLIQNFKITSTKIVREIKKHKNKRGRKYKQSYSGDGYNNSHYEDW